MTFRYISKFFDFVDSIHPIELVMKVATNMAKPVAMEYLCYNDHGYVVLVVITIRSFPRS